MRFMNLAMLLTLATTSSCDIGASSENSNLMLVPTASTTLEAAAGTEVDDHSKLASQTATCRRHFPQANAKEVWRFFNETTGIWRDHLADTVFKVDNEVADSMPNSAPHSSMVSSTRSPKIIQPGIAIAPDLISFGNVNLAPVAIPNFESEDYTARGIEPLKNVQSMVIGPLIENGFRIIQLNYEITHELRKNLDEYSAEFTPCDLIAIKATSLADGRPALLIRGPFAPTQLSPNNATDAFENATRSGIRVFIH